MEKINNRVTKKALWFTVMFFLINIAVLAQDSTIMSTPSSPSGQDLSFNTDATQLANDLVRQTGLSTDKADRISQILEEYRNDLAEARTNYFEERQNSGVTGSESRVDMEGILGDNVEQYYAGATPDLMSDYKDADENADEKIYDVFDNEVQKSRYEQVKNQWWGDVKEKIFSSLTQNSQQPMD